MTWQASSKQPNLQVLAAVQPIQPVQPLRERGVHLEDIPAERHAVQAVPQRDALRGRQSGAYTHSLFGSTQAHFVRYVWCMVSSQSIMG